MGYNDTIIFDDHFRAEIVSDPDCESPLEFQDDSIKLMILHKRYINPSKGKFDSPNDVSEFLKKNKDWMEYPLYLYDHSGTVYSITPFSCQWDSGRVGSVLIDKTKSPNPQKSAESICDEYTQWANGECFGYSLYKNDEIIDSCFGFIGRDCVEASAREQYENLSGPSPTMKIP